MKNSSNFLELSEKYRVIIFDLDNTIYPQLEYDSIVFRKFFKQHGLDENIGDFLAEFKIVWAMVVTMFLIFFLIMKKSI